MNNVKFINPDGQEVEVPETDAPHFEAMGWPSADAPTKTNKNTK